MLIRFILNGDCTVNVGTVGVLRTTNRRYVVRKDATAASTKTVRLRRRLVRCFGDCADVTEPIWALRGVRGRYGDCATPTILALRMLYGRCGDCVGAKEIERVLQATETVQALHRLHGRCYAARTGATGTAWALRRPQGRYVAYVGSTASLWALRSLYRR